MVFAKGDRRYNRLDCFHKLPNKQGNSLLALLISPIRARYALQGIKLITDHGQTYVNLGIKTMVENGKLQDASYVLAGHKEWPSRQGDPTKS
ncbi:hypothetical protein CEXT_310301 [Caerostris extrusa]|uniref:Transposase n=1 Tax=Caerostris extrusa TaxID=172846 RepID=A0AAV4M766_CAEEX|nr:hypothetical protein CEXT_310301 [Caerostris extrusa]